ncbi:MAG: hypothetical protein V5A56_15840 [Halolamina sp.]
MNIVIDVPDSLVGRMKRAVAAGNYDDPQEFVRTAIENQIQLEEEASQEAKTLEEALNSVEQESEIEASSEETQPDDSALEQAQERQSDDAAAADWTNETTLSLARREYGDVPTVAPPKQSRLDKGPLWGQYNRIFPVKLVVRGLANALLDSSEAGPPDGPWLDLQPFQRRAARTAREIGTEIATQDERAGRKRGEKLAAALPTGDDPEKSMDRFETHFIGRVEHDDELTGALPHLSFVDIVRESPQQIGLTDAGREFATLPNPLLDDGVDADKSLSQEEREFYISHVRDVRAEEYAAMQKIAQAIEEGDNRPTSLTERVAYLNPEWSNSQAETIRSGLTSRMYELGLVDRSQVGQRGIGYELTAAGETFRSNDTESTQPQ